MNLPLWLWQQKTLAQKYSSDNLVLGINQMVDLLFELPISYCRRPHVFCSGSYVCGSILLFLLVQLWLSGISKSRGCHCTRNRTSTVQNNNTVGQNSWVSCRCGLKSIQGQSSLVINMVESPFLVVKQTQWYLGWSLIRIKGLGQVPRATHTSAVLSAAACWGGRRMFLALG